MPAPRPSQVDTWQRAEKNAAAWMRWWGHADARDTGQGADGGIDVRAETALGQVKTDAHNVGRPALQRLVGARGRNHDQALFFFSGFGFSRQAIEYADDMEIALFRFALNGAMSPVNEAARVVLSWVELREAQAARAREVATQTAAPFRRPTTPRPTQQAHRTPAPGTATSAAAPEEPLSAWEQIRKDFRAAQERHRRRPG
ncbi:restriction endonuclease [Blastococcus sp. LR1]|uniref:restriction endonuclease n=1 Tax=Blastococcus sp. LR1 TaxID=2877000 RepID=UPI001CCC9644|nr:restriction endonuclease [Blastococcus sp. LR1]MCA0146777.1 restriction endonuclease [Blastococcus sp. LR1]